MRCGAEVMRWGAEEMRCGAEEMGWGAEEMRRGAEEMRWGDEDIKCGAMMLFEQLKLQQPDSLSCSCVCLMTHRAAAMTSSRAVVYAL